MSDNDNIKEQIKALEKKQTHAIDNQVIFNKNILEQITELKEWKDEFRTVDGVVDEYKRSQKAMKEQIAELKNQIKEINKILVVITEGRVLELNSITNLEEVLRSLFDRIIYISRVYESERHDKFLKELQDWRINLRGLIKKLDSPKKDSETLKKIKQLAHAESEFYNKHGYFSFWSDKLKAQRIKEMILLKHLKDHKKVSEDQRKGIDIKELFNEFDKANDELIKNLETEKKEVFDNVCICGHTDPAHDPVECKYCDCTEYKKDPIKNEMVTRKKTENKCKICGEKNSNEDGFCSSECFEKAQWESKEKPCNRCDHLIKNINKYGHFYCRELDMKMDEFVEKCVHFAPKKKEKEKYKDLGMITSKDGELSIYTPSQFVKDYAKTHKLFSLYGLISPEEALGGEKDISRMSDLGLSPRKNQEGRDSAVDSKLLEPIDPCISCSDGNMCEEQCELSKDAEKEYEKYAKAMREKEKFPETKFLCGNCGKQFESYHDGDGIQTGLCQKCHWDEFIGKLEAEPKKDYSLDDVEKVEK